MALVNSCVCCTLVQGCVVCGIYGMLVYLVAFSLELWWIIESDEGLPAPAYILGVCYLLVFVNSIIMLAGLNTKSRFLLGWLFMMVLFLFPECGMVLFMSLYHWKIDSMRGLAELVFYVCRAAINVTAVICVQSLYTTWRDERAILRRLEALNMHNMYAGSTVHQNGQVMNGKANGMGYQNYGYINTSERDIVNGAPRTTNLKRSVSSVSHIVNRGNPTPFGGSIPVNMASYPPHYAPYPLPFRKDGSEFNASTFSGFFPVIAHRTNSEAALNLSKSQNGFIKTDWIQNQSKTMLSEDYREWFMAGTPISRPVSAGTVDVLEFGTQSLDRKLYRARRSNSFDGFHGGLRTFPRPLHSSHSSMGGASDDITRYKDVAL